MCRYRSAVFPLVFIFVLQASRQETYARELSGFLESSHSLANESSIDLRLPDGTRGLKVPVSIHHEDVSIENNVGLSWSIYIPYLRIDIEKQIRAGSPDLLLTSNFTGSLIRRDNRVIPTHQSNDQDLECFSHGGPSPQSFSCYFKHNNVIWNFGGTAQSRLTIGENHYYWYLSSIENKFGDKLEFVYQAQDTTNPLALPLLKEIKYPLQDIRVLFNFNADSQEPIYKYIAGRRIEARNRLANVVIHQKYNHRALYHTQFNYVTYSPSSNGSVFLSKVIRRDGAPDSTCTGIGCTPPVEIAYCYVGTCKPNEIKSEVGQITGNGLAKTYFDKASFGGTLFSSLGNSGLPTIFSPTKYTSTSNSLGIIQPTIRNSNIQSLASLHFELSPTLIGVHRNFNSETWGLTDFNGDQRDDVWWLDYTSTGTSQTNLIHIMLAKDDGTIDINRVYDITVQMPVYRRELMPVGRFMDDERFAFLRISQESKKMLLYWYDYKTKDFKSSSNNFNLVWVQILGDLAADSKRPIKT
jgi:hypothetical protein